MPKLKRNRFRTADAVKMGEPLIVVDAGIPGVRQQFEGLGRVRALPAHAIDRTALRDAHALIIRSTTRVDASLVDNSSIRFVGSATSGADHVDRALLRRNGIRFAHARGANAESVGDFVAAALLRVAARRGMGLRGLTVGIVGCGNVGGRLAPRLRGLGMVVLERDPPRQRRAERSGRHGGFVSMERILAESDIVTLHTPLIRHGRDRTRHLVGDTFLERLRPGAWLVNTARGEVVDEEALVRSGHSGALVLDVWGGEPAPDPGLVRRADVATAHIAGYALDSKLEATRRMARALARHLGVRLRTVRHEEEPPIPLAAPGEDPLEVGWLDALVRSAYDIERDDRDLRRVVAGPAAGIPAGFEALRSGYPVRRLISRYGVRQADVPPGLREAVFTGLGFARL